MVLSFLHICFINIVATTNTIHGCFYLPTICAPREVHWDWGGHDWLCCTLSQNIGLPLYIIHFHNALHYWRQLEYSVIGIGISEVHMHSKITPFSHFHFPADFSWNADSRSSICKAVLSLKVHLGPCECVSSIC
jgi:hypothetical protein